MHAEVPGAEHDIRFAAAVKDRFLVMDRKTSESWWQYGAQQESAEDALRKQMTPDRLQELIGRLDEWQLF